MGNVDIRYWFAVKWRWERWNALWNSGNQGWKPPQSHHYFATLATKMQEIKHVHAENTPQFCHLRTTISPFPHHIFTVNKPCKRLKNTWKPLVYAAKQPQFHLAFIAIWQRTAANKPRNRLKNRWNREIGVWKRHIRVGKRSICMLSCRNGVWKWGNCVSICRNCVGKWGNLGLKFGDWVRKTLYQSSETGYLYRKTPQIESENEGFISQTAIFAQCNRSIAPPNRRNLHSTRRHTPWNSRFRITNSPQTTSQSLE